MTGIVLLCTVGGAHQPILRAIESTKPRHVCFFCTDRDPETGKPGSIVQVTGKGAVIKAHRDDKKPTLPNIPTQAGLADECFETRVVPADDLDGAYLVMRTAVAELAHRLPGTRFVADYTGGTKTMTAALTCAALESEDVELQLVAGARPDLFRVANGTEHAVVASVARLRLDRAMAPYLGAWRRFAYHEAAEGLDDIRIAADAADRARLALAQAMSRALARWDDFDHAGALDLLDTYAGRVAPSYPSMLPALRWLTRETGKQREPARLWDLWLNAERRASQGRFDDAVARVYRLIEWTAQWQLRDKIGADTADFPPERLPASVDAPPARDGKIKIGLWSAWQISGGVHAGTGAGPDCRPRRGAAQPALHSQRLDPRARLPSGSEIRLGADAELDTRRVLAGSSASCTGIRFEESAGTASGGAAGVCPRDRVDDGTGERLACHGLRDSLRSWVVCYSLTLFDHFLSKVLAAPVHLRLTCTWLRIVSCVTSMQRVNSTCVSPG